METTKINPQRTAQEIVSALVAGGAQQVNQEFKDGRIVGLHWTLLVNGSIVPFSMPARVDQLYAVLLEEARRSTRWWDGSTQTQQLREKAERVAWRQLLRWVQAQLAMIDTGMVQAAEVFMPYIQRGDRTLWQELAEGHFKMLAAPAEKQECLR
jgi:hypothetical protein